MGSERKVFSEQEVTALVKRAVELQENAGKESYTPGVTPEELSRIAGELGIEPRFLQQAIDEATSTKPAPPGFHLTEEFERVVDTELSPEDYDVLLRHLRPVGNHRGFTQVGRTLSGQTWTGCSMANVEITSKKGRTRVRTKSNGWFAWLVSLHPATIASFVLLASLGSEGQIWMALGLTLLIMSVAFLAFRELVKIGHRATERLTNTLAGAVAETAPDHTLPATATSASEELQSIHTTG
ncbi:MAG TPA: hypothetical protein VMI31_15635 [Fimbriimonadaceae bacterium]|nr:hypothetical protein [Fimbriimonadaceae bacterium]